MPSMVGGRLTRFCFPRMKTVMYSLRRRFFSAFSAAVSFRLFLPIAACLILSVVLCEKSIRCCTFVHLTLFVLLPVAAKAAIVSANLIHYIYPLRVCSDCPPGAHRQAAFGILTGYTV
jgi:hypothetical protein